MKITHLNIGNELIATIPAGQMRYAKSILRAADAGGTIQAGDARDLFGDPRNHTTMSLARAFRIAGFTLEEA